MPMSFSPCYRWPDLTRVLLLCAALSLSACASKNPLKSAPSDAPKTQATTAKSAPTSAAPTAASTPIAKPQATVTAASKPAPSAYSAIPNTLQPSLVKRWLGIFSPYKIDIQQGNFISQEMAARLRKGLTKEQVRFLLGVPLLTDMFHATRWDYLFRLQKADGQITTNRLTVFFKDNRVARFESSQLPDEAAYISHISGTPTPAKIEKVTPVTPAKTTPPTSDKQMQKPNPLIDSVTP